MGVLKVKTADGFVDAGAALSLIGGGTVEAVLEELTITENGEYTPSAGVDGFSKVIAAIEASGGAELQEPQLLCTLTAEMTLKELLTAHPIPRKYKRSFVVFVHRGTNIATGGSGTQRQIIFYCHDGNAQNEMFMVNGYSNSLVAPDSMSIIPSASANGTYFSVREEDGFITASGSTNTTRNYAAGNTIEYIEIPFNYDTLTMDTTEWGAG